MFEKDIFIDNLRRLILNKGETATQFAKQVGVNKSTVSKWFGGDRLPSIATLWRIADHFEISVDELIGRER